MEIRDHNTGGVHAALGVLGKGFNIQELATGPGALASPIFLSAVTQVLLSIGHCCLDAAVPSHLRRQ